MFSSNSEFSSDLSFGKEGIGRLTLCSRPPAVNFDACLPVSRRSMVSFRSDRFDDIALPLATRARPGGSAVTVIMQRAEVHRIPPWSVHRCQKGRPAPRRPAGLVGVSSGSAKISSETFSCVSALIAATYGKAKTAVMQFTKIKLATTGVNIGTGFASVIVSAGSSAMLDGGASGCSRRWSPLGASRRPRFKCR